MLSAFQSDLGNISGEIQSLQEQSMSMSVKLTNRKSVQEPLSAFISSLALSSELIDAILELDVNDEFEVRASEVGPARFGNLRPLNLQKSYSYHRRP